MRLAIEHDTHYRYDSPVRRSIQYLRLTPLSSARQQVLQWQLTLPANASAGMDAYGNTLHVLTLDRPHSEIRLHASGVVETRDGAALAEPDSRLPPAVFLRDSVLTQADAALSDFALPYAGKLIRSRREGLLTLMAALAARMPYTPGSTDAATPASAAFARASGVCQDHAQVFAACARKLGVPARYVSGYLAADAEHVASHAWTEVWLDEGWIGIDVSNQCLAEARHVKLAIGLDYLDACPVRGMRVGGGNEAMLAVARVAASEQ
ncbi:transglutaminase family protein [Chitinimonas sp. BJYL2]|uniref:transglutaminase family protein n=1 Tax=Chitinimonas sp. BJYL2 TaxID=2976696 RepID=UPI0022B3A922|nr:transglutaminase family protein [Chitinimonas sp. BJYL2]